MTEAKAVMAQEEFEQHHSRSWDYAARVGLVWEGMAEEQQAIIDGKGYRYMGYGSHQEYWESEFAEKTGWKYEAIRQWMTARRVKRSTPTRFESTYMPSGPGEWKRLGAIKDPNDRVEFLERYEYELKPKIKADGAENNFLHEAIKEFKGERKAGVIERMRENGTLVPTYPTGPTPEEEAYNAASQLLSVAMDVTPEAAADSISPGLAQTTAQRYEALIPWTRRFVAQLHLRAGGGR